MSVPQARATYVCEVLLYESSQTEADKKDLVAVDCGVHRISVRKAEEEEEVFMCVCVCVFGGEDQKEFGINVRKEKVRRARGVCQRQ